MAEASSLHLAQITLWVWLAALLTRLLRRRSAQLRNLIWTAALPSALIAVQLCACDPAPPVPGVQVAPAVEKPANQGDAEPAPDRAAGWPTQVRISLGFGHSQHPQTGERFVHLGLDLVNRIGEPVLATGDGRVLFAGPKGPQGNRVVVGHGDGLSSTYAHLDSIWVEILQEVVRGQIIGTVGNSGESSSPHLHFDLQQKGRMIDPLPLLGQDDGLLWPTRARITSPFGPRRNPLTGTQELHRGIDIANRAGEPVVATAAGRVVKAGDEGAMGLCLELDHGAGQKTRYCHLGALEVAAADRVVRGQVIARIGSSGRSTGPHVHYEILEDGQPLDPAETLDRLPESPPLD